MVVRSFFRQLTGLATLAFLQGCAVSVDTLETGAGSRGSLHGGKLRYSLFYNSGVRGADDTCRPLYYNDRKHFEHATTLTEKILKEEGIEAELRESSCDADLVVNLETLPVEETAWDWVCGLSLGLIPAYKQDHSLEIRLSDRNSGTSKTYFVKTHIFVHLFLMPISFFQVIGNLKNPYPPEESEYRKALKDFLGSAASATGSLPTSPPGRGAFAGDPAADR